MCSDLFEGSVGMLYGIWWVCSYNIMWHIDLKHRSLYLLLSNMNCSKHWTSCIFQSKIWALFIIFQNLTEVWCYLTHWGRNKMDAISQTTFSSAFPWMKMFEFRLKVPKGPITNIPALVQIMAWRRPGDKPLSEPMMVRLPTHMCVTRPQWVNQCRLGHRLKKIDL